MSTVEFILQNRAEVVQLTLEHIFIVGISTLIAVLIGFPLGVFITRRKEFGRPLMTFANVIQTVPSLALFGFLIPMPFLGGIGAKTAIIALILYSLLPIMRSTYSGITNVDSAVRESAIGMGMTDWQLLRHVEVPLALGVIFSAFEWQLSWRLVSPLSLRQ